MNASHTGELTASSSALTRRRAPLTEQFPLGSAITSSAPAHTARNGTQPTLRTRPYGAQFATAATPIALDLAYVRYDIDRQIAVIDVDGETLPLLDPRLGLTLHTTGTVPNEDEVFDKDEKY